jgi:hypothetical protein
MAQYKIQARNGEVICVQVEINDLHIHQAVAFYDVLTKAFRGVDVIDNDTGEVVMSKYIASDFFYPKATVADVLEELENLRLAFLER